MSESNRSIQQLVSIAKAAERLGLAEVTIRSWIAARRIGHVRLGRAIRIPLTEIERLVQTGFVPASPERVSFR
jgi:excisionase family DNA binding protein